jgi:predicted DNA-binding protein (MmcQ/YjbR family)
VHSTPLVPLPGAEEHFPWGEVVAKVNKRIFVYLGRDEDPETRISVKLSSSHEQALAIANAVPTGYGLGKHGWLTLPVRDLDADLINEWVEESYRMIAPKKLIAQLDAAA